MKLSPILRMANIKALVTRTKKIPATVESISVEELPKESKVKQSPGICDTIVKVKYSTLNYKDALVSIQKSEHRVGLRWLASAHVGSLSYLNIFKIRF